MCFEVRNGMGLLLPAAYCLRLSKVPALQRRRCDPAVQMFGRLISVPG
jgi:hypothetical protein